VERDEELMYTIRVVNLGQPATQLVITDAIPSGTTYVPGSATSGGRLESGEVIWGAPSLDAGEYREFSFRVTVAGGSEVVNERYGARCAEGAIAVGDPLVTEIAGGGEIYLPLVLRNY
jgi:uncharacterized repeat protein (TIGR01451 family)